VLNTLSTEQARADLKALLLKQSVFHGDFLLASGARSKYYFDCRLTTLDPQGAWLVGQLMHEVIRREERTRQISVDAVGGLTMGADPVALAVTMASYALKEGKPWQTFSVRKTPKAHGQTKLIEGNFHKADTVVVVDDVVTRGDSTIAALNAVINEGGKPAFVMVVVDRQEGGKEKIEALGFPVFALFQRDELLAASAPPG